MEEERSNIHVLMVPWLATGHILPFFVLSKRLALKGIKTSFFSTPSNILRLPPIPKSLTPLIKLIPCSVSSNIDNIANAKSDSERFEVFEAYASLEQHLINFLVSKSCDGEEEEKASWLIYDFPGMIWASSLASRFNLNFAQFGIANAATAALLDLACQCESAEELTNVEKRLPFATNISIRSYEARDIFALIPKKRYDHNVTLLRTCKELDGKWLEYLGEKCVPVGFMPPTMDDDGEEEEEKWGRSGVREWLDGREDLSVVYVAFGSEVELKRWEIDEIGAGLERSGLPFVWVLRVGSPPEGFAERTAGRGIVYDGWVQQTRVLAHRAIGGFLTHGGWNSATEGLGAGAAMVVLPMRFEQGLIAQHLVECGYAVEVERNDRDGSFTREDIATKLRIAMVEEEGEELRKKARMGKQIFGSPKLQQEYIHGLVNMLAMKPA